MSIFKKETKPLYKEKTCSCPICGNTVKYREYDFSQIDYYMDGRPKMKFVDCIKQFGVCEKCGYVFIPTYFRNENVILEGKIRDFVFSKEFEQIRKSETLTEEEKFLLSIEFLADKPGNQATIMMYEMYKLWYYEEKETKEFVDKYRKYFIKQLSEKYWSTSPSVSLRLKQLNFKTKNKTEKLLVISRNEMVIDFYRTIGDFENADRVLKMCFEQYPLKSADSPLKTYLNQQKSLINKKIIDEI